METDPELISELVEDGDPVLVFDMTGVCRFANRLGVEALATTDGEVVGRRVATELSTLGEPALLRTMDIVRSTAHEQLVEVRNPATSRWFEGRAVPAEDRITLYLHDVTARRLHEAARVKSQHEVLAASAGGRAGTFTIEFATGLMHMSPEAIEIYGLDPALGAAREWVTVRERDHPDDRTRTAQAVAEAAARPGSFSDLTYRICREAGGDTRLVHVVAVAVMGEGGRVAMLSGSITDITDLQAAQDALVASEERLRRTLENVDAIVCYAEFDGAPVVANPSVERILGYRPDELATFDAWDSRIHPDDIGLCREAWARTNEPWNLRYRIRHAEGGWVWLSDRGRWILRDDGLGNGLFSVAVDITRLVADEEAHRTSEARLRAITSTAHDAILTLDEDGRIDSCNPAAERIFGRAAADLIGSRIIDLVPSGVAPMHLRALHRLGRGEDVGLEERVMAMSGRRADGTPFNAEVSIASWELDGKRFVTAIVRDASADGRAGPAPAAG